MTPGGFGPWFCALLFNTAHDSKKQIHLIAHTLPHLACDMLNRNGVNNTDCWVIVLKIGPFECWDTAVAFLTQWMSRKRGKQRRLERGLELFAQYSHPYNLMLWSQRLDQDAVRQRVQAQQLQPQRPEDALENDPDDDDSSGNLPQDKRRRLNTPASTTAAAASSAPSLQAIRQCFQAGSALNLGNLNILCRHLRTVE